MKITILIMTVCLLQVSALTKAQISIDAKQESLREVLKKISQQSGYDFIYSVSDFKDAKPVDLKLNNVSLDLALRAAFYSQPLIYEVSDRTVMVRKKEEKTYIQTVIDRFQAIDVRGKVVDSLGNGLAGATVSVKNGKGSTSTLANGDFVLKNVDEGAILSFNYLGYVAKDLPVSKEFMYVQLQQSSSKLDEVQIMAYGKTSKRLSAGSITTIKAEEIARQPVDNPLLALMGRVPNLDITPASGLPGAAIKIQLRGQNSLYRNAVVGNQMVQSEPLIVIDGVPYANQISGPGAGTYGNTSALSYINPSDIESIDVLSDADATSIYGSRGGNGVILITTKKGKSGKTSVSVSANLGINEVSRKLELLNTEQYLNLRKEAFTNDNLTPQLTNRSARTYAPDLLLWDQNRYTDWQEVFLGGTGKRVNTQASVSGGTALIQYLISGTYGRQGYVFPGKSKDETGTGHFSLTGTTSDQKFRAMLSGSYTMKNRLSPSIDFTRTAVTLAPNAPSLYTTGDQLNWEPNPNISVGSATWSNPYSNLLRTLEEKTNGINVSTDISYRFIPELSAKITGGFNNLNLAGITIQPTAAYDPSFALDSRTGSASRNNSDSKSWSIEPQLVYSSIVSKGKLDGLLGFSIQGSSLQSQNLFARGYRDDAQIRNLLAAQMVFGAPAYSASNTSSQYKYMAVFGRLAYNWEDKYLLNLTARRDGSSRFGPKNEFGNFWSIGAAWLFSNEQIIKDNLTWLSFAKIRGSYGSSGNDNIGDYQYMELYETYTPEDMVYQDLPAVVSPGAVNPYYSWENIHKLEIGLDLGFLDDRILLGGAYWRTRSSNQLGKANLPATAGNISITANLGAKIQNSGYDLSINTRNIVSHDFSWSTSGNFGLQRNKLLAIPDESFWGGNPPPYPIGVNPVGKPFTGFEARFEYKGVDPETGLYQFLDSDGNLTSMDPRGRPNIISIVPQYSGGVNNNFRFKGIGLDVFFQFVKQNGRNYLFDTGFNSPGYWNLNGANGNLPIEYLNHWRQEGDLVKFQKVAVNHIGGSDLSAKYGYARDSDFGIVDASFIRLQNIQLSYDLSKKCLEKTYLSNLRFYVQGQNLLTITNYKGLDPQVQGATNLPMLKTFVFGLQVGF